MSGAVIESDARLAARTNMFIAAAMYVAGASSPVKVRNLSPGGALIETSVAPIPGTVLKLCRGSLLASGRVVWSANNRIGLEFEATISVSDWMAPQVNSGQAQVDALIARSRAEGRSSEPIISLVQREPSIGWDARVLEISNLIGALGDSLASDSETVSRHGVELQKIDQVLQMLEGLRRTAPER